MEGCFSQVNISRIIAISTLPVLHEVLLSSPILSGIVCVLHLWCISLIFLVLNNSLIYPLVFFF